MTDSPESALVWDASALHHFARADRVDVLADLLRGRRNVTTRVVVHELQTHGLADPVLASGWLEEVRLDELRELTAFVQWSARVGMRNDRNAGEATVLAWAAVHGAIAIIDDHRARGTGVRGGVDAHGTLWLFAGAVRAGRITESAVTGLLRTVEEAGGRYPREAVSDFGRWARSAGLL